MRFTGFVAKVVAIVVFLTCTVFMPLPKTSNAYVGWVGAAGSPYIGSAATQPADIDVSDIYTTSITPSLALDSSGYPCIAWDIYTSDNFEVCFTRWNGSQWTDASGATFTAANGIISNNAYNSKTPSLALDSNGFPCLAWSDASTTLGGNYDIYFARWNGSSWVNVSGAALTASNANISNNAGDSINPSVSMDSTNNPCIAWEDRTLGTYEVYYSRWNGSSWVNASGLPYPANSVLVSQQNGRDSGLPCLRLGSNNYPCISWQDNDTTSGTSNIFFAKWDGAAWVNAANLPFISAVSVNVSRSTAGSGSSSLRMDSNNQPNICWHDYVAGNSEIFFVKWDGNQWVGANGLLYDPSTGNNANLSANSGLSYRPSLALDASGNPCIAWDDSTPGNTEVYFARWNGSSWVNVANDTLTNLNGNMSNNSGNSWDCDMALDSGGNPNITWVDPTYGGVDILFDKFEANFDGSFNVTKSVDTNDDGDYSDSGKNVAAGDTLRYKINWKFNQGQDALENPYLYDTIPDGTTYVSGSASPTANISYSTDAGATWVTGEPPNGSPAGTQLRWSINGIWIGANDNEYNTLTGENANISNNNKDSINPKLVLDSKGYPHIVWEDSSFNSLWKIYYIHWNGANWVGANGSLYDPSTSSQPPDINVSGNVYDSEEPDLVLDSNDMPYIVWRSRYIFFVHWEGNNWIGANGSVYNSTLPSQPPDIAITTTWGEKPRIVLDKSNRPCVVWSSQSYSFGGKEEIMYVHWNGLTWVGADGSVFDSSSFTQPLGINISRNSESSYNPRIILDKNDYPNIIWRDLSYGNPDILYVKWDGNDWIGVNNSLYLPSSPSQPFDINISRSGGDSDRPNFVLDNLGQPHVVWEDFSFGGKYEIIYVRWNGSNWVGASNSVYNPGAPQPLDINVSRSSEISRYASVALDKSNKPCICYSDIQGLGFFDIYFVKWSGGNWVSYNPTISTNVSRNGGPSANPSLALTSNDEPKIVWSDKSYNNNFEILYVQYYIPEYYFTFSVKIDNPPTSYGMCNHATFRHKWDKGVAIESNEVCNTIKFNYTGTFTLEKGVDSNGDGKYTDNGATITPGTTLGYKLDWTFDNPNNDPLNGAYIYDTVPLGTKYVAGSSPTFNLSYSTDNGFSWLAGEPPDGSAAGTILRWKLTQPGWTNAQGQLVNSTNPNMSKNTGISDFPSLAVYKDGHPSIAWSDDVLGTTMVYYAKWNGSQWVNAAGLPFTAANGNVAGLIGGDPSLALDPITGNPWIAFQSNGIVFTNLEIHVVKWNGSQWTNTAGMPATLVNSNVSNNAGLSWFPSQLVLDSKGYPCIVWKDNTTGSFQNYFARWNGTNWTNAAGTILNTTNGSMNNNVVNSFWPTISLDANDRPYVAWDNNFGTNFEIYFAKWDGTQWVTASGTPLTPTNGNISNNTGSSQIPFVFTDRVTGNPCIAWSDDTPGNYEIYFAKWNGSAWVNSDSTAIDSTNPNMSHTSGGSYLLSLALDFNNLPAISWEDDTTGNSEIYYSKWSGSAWVNAKGDAFTAANGIIGTSPARSWFPSLAFDPVTGNPNIAWLDKTPGNNEVYFAKWTEYHQTFTFSVKVDKPFSVPALSPICNSATFSHAFDGGNPLSSNSVCVKVKGASEVKGANLVIRKTAKSLQYNPKDTFVFQITVANNGSTAAENVVLTDNFPNELVFDSSMPSGQAGLSSVKFSLGTLAPNTSTSFTLKFKLSPKTTIDDCITVINEAIASSGTLIAKDTAAINICTPKAPCELYIDTKWTNVIKGVRTRGVPVKLEVIPRCGSSPYSVKVEWGDGSTNSGTVEGEGKSYITGHTFADTGDFTVKITCVDAYGSTRIVTKTLKQP